MSFLKNISSALASLGKQKTKSYLENNTVDENSSEELEGDKSNFISQREILSIIFSRKTRQNFAIFEGVPKNTYF